MQTGHKKWVILQTGGGFFTLTSGFVLLCLLNWERSLYFPVNLALGLAGITLCTIGIRLLLIATDDKPAIQVDDAELGCLQLNGYYLVAYERETPEGKKQFRLVSSRTFTPEREAALIRYLTLEGFLVSLWPEMKERLQEEVEWAFLA
jgi:uncharacterized membrane protein YedE/YeeE